MNCSLHETFGTSSEFRDFAWRDIERTGFRQVVDNQITMDALFED